MKSSEIHPGFLEAKSREPSILFIAAFLNAETKRSRCFSSHQTNHDQAELKKKTEGISLQGGNYRKLIGGDPLNKTSDTPTADPLDATSGTHAGDPFIATSGTDAQAHKVVMILIRVEGSFR